MRRARPFAVLGALWRLNAAEELQYRANFVASFASTVFYLLTALLTLSLFFSHAASLGGWDFWEVVVLLGVFNALSGLVEAIGACLEYHSLSLVRGLRRFPLMK